MSRRQSSAQFPYVLVGGNILPLLFRAHQSNHEEFDFCYLSVTYANTRNPGRFLVNIDEVLIL